MSNKKNSPFDSNSDSGNPGDDRKNLRKATPKLPPPDSDFDPTVPEDGVELPEDTSELQELYSRHLPSRAEIAAAARESFGTVLSEQALESVMHSSAEINESVRRIMHEHMNLGFRFAEIVRSVQDAYVIAYEDTPKTVNRATALALGYIEKLHQISSSKIRIHIGAYNKFHANAEAVEFLRLTDMQALLGHDIGDDIVEAIIEKRKDDPEMSTRAVKDLIKVLRQQTDELRTSKEQLESVSDEFSRTVEQLNIANAEGNRLRQQIEQVRLDQAAQQNTQDRLRNELSLVTNTSATLNQELRDMQQQRDAAIRAVEEARNRPPMKTEDKQTKEEIRQRDAELEQLIQKKRVIEAEIEEQESLAAGIRAKLEESQAALEASRKLEEEMSALVTDFSSLAQRYHSAQLLCTAEGNPKRFQAIFQALADLIGKFHLEISAAAKTA
ncbi:hypothetical protein [Paraburkholderia tropica]|uniref:hypothetical protein n=1 Tax=Paraburkholderia tropica TaxID=92647 RepID=UPI0007ED92AA|nr:hypothetical protein [Paraburkholderia tropica]OBR54039.1 hypothetical protein A6456_22190 [Paraburkholderia tropica]